MLNKITVAMVFLSLSFSSLLNAEQFDYYHGMPIVLGGTWDPYYPMRNRNILGCFSPEVSNESPVAADKFSQRFVNSFSEFRKTVGLNFSGSGSGGFGIAKVSASGSYEEERNLFKNKRNVVWIVSGARTYEPVFTQKITISETGKEKLQKLKENNNSETFYKACGRSFVTSIARETKIDLVYTFTATNSEKASKIRSAISGSFTSPKLETEASVNLINKVKQVDNNVILEIEIYQSGVMDKSDALNQILAVEPGNLQDVRKKLGAALDSITWSSSRISKFSADPIKDYFEIEGSSKMAQAEMIYEKAGRMKNISNKLIERYMDLEDILEGASLSEIKLKPNAEVEIGNEKKIIEGQIDDLSNNLKECLRGGNNECTVPDIKVLWKKLQWMELNFGRFDTWEYKASGVYDRPAAHVVSQATYWPVFYIQNIDLIKHIELFRNNQIIKRLSSQRIEKVINESTLNFRDIWSTKYHGRAWCPPEKWGEQCNPWAADNRGHANGLKENEKGINYRLEIYDIEGGSHIINMKNPSEINY